MKVSSTVQSEGSPGERSPRANHFAIIDALRFVLAFWVAVGHFGVIPLFAGVGETGIGHSLSRAWSSVVFGSPAVIGFFVISGFCIHLPFIAQDRLHVGRYYLRRYTRILIPVAGALLIYRLWGEEMVFRGEKSILWASPLWSLACEEIYYAIYPLLRWLRRRFGWAKLLAPAFMASIAIALPHRHAAGWHDLGPFGTALVLLPVWLLGCLLAEQVEALSGEISTARIWAWRGLVWFCSWLTEMGHFKLRVSYTQTMLWFGVLAYFWVRQEIIYGKKHAPSHMLAAGGAWSYSLYLVHVQGMEVPGRLEVPNLGFIPNWVLGMTCCLVLAYAFYVLVERPSHRLARRVRVADAQPPLAERASALNA